MLGKILKIFLISLSILGLSACKQNNFIYSKLEPIQFKNEPSSNLLKKSKTLSYSETFSFVPTFLGNDKIVYGYSIDEQGKKSSLISLNLTNNEYSVVKSVNFDENPITFGIYYADKNYVIFNEYHYEEKESKYFLWSKKDNDFLEILSISGVHPLHFTEISKWKNIFIIITSDSTGNYPIISYNLESKERTIVESKNSGHPVVIDNTLYYLLFDNKQLTTSLISYDLLTFKKSELSKTNGKDEFYNGLNSDGNDLITVKQTPKGTTFYQGYGNNSKKLLFSEYSEAISSHNGFLTFLGNNRISNDGRLQYYLYDLNKKIKYNYDGNILYLSDIGIFWVEYLLPESKIANGEVFKKENSRMRFLEFNKYRKTKSIVSSE
ncbi:hypothetical protein BN1356_02550 [Streptococcus varani]|uniref:Lipoprotein n=1 Tax=Streptococcus varani TaxID=1608583 RepID=A0A0E4H5N0_9STRE|nr:hypothetical protein [Streptococcus varani]CQR26193.1 hypothetical protein BN1356_02550 [Streptococcus varani]